MNPLHLLVVASLLARLAMWAWRWSTGEKPAPEQRSAPADALVIVWVGVVGVAATAGLVLGGPLAWPLVVPAALLALEPSSLAELGARRGWPWAARWTARVSTVVWRRDRPGGAEVMAARATVAAGRVPEPPAPFGPVNTGLVVAAGIAAGARGERAEARSLIAAAGWFDAQPEPLAAIRHEWIAADLAARGQWDRLAALPDEEVSTPRLRLLRAAAERLLDLDDAPDAVTFERLARVARGDPRWTPLLDRARAARHRPAFTAPDLPEDAEVRALEVHRRALLDPAWLDAAVDAWDDAPPPAAIRDRVLEDLDAAFSAADRVPEDRDGPLSAALRDLRHGRVLDALASQAQALGARVTSRRDLDPLAEVREFAWFVVALPLADEVPQGAAALRRRMWFRACHGPLVDWSADLYNRRKQGFLFRAVTRWLLAQAVQVGDEATAEVLRRNLRVSAAFS